MDWKRFAWAMVWVGYMIAFWSSFLYLACEVVWAIGGGK